MDKRVNIPNLRWRVGKGYSKTGFLAGIPVFAEILVLVDKKLDWHFGIPVPVNKNRNCDLEIPVPVEKNQNQALNIRFWFQFLKTSIRS